MYDAGSDSETRRVMVEMAGTFMLSTDLLAEEGSSEVKLPTASSVPVGGTELLDTIPAMVEELPNKVGEARADGVEARGVPVEFSGIENETALGPTSVELVDADTTVREALSPGTEVFAKMLVGTVELLVGRLVDEGPEDVARVSRWFSYGMCQRGYREQ